MSQCYYLVALVPSEVDMLISALSKLVADSKETCPEAEQLLRQLTEHRKWHPVDARRGF